MHRSCRECVGVSDAVIDEEPSRVLLMEGEALMRDTMGGERER